MATVHVRANVPQTMSKIGDILNLGVNMANIVGGYYLAPPVATAATNITTSSFDANWLIVNIADGYYLDVAYDSGFTLYVSGYQNLDVGNVLTYTVDELNDNETYYYRLRAYDEGNTSLNSNTITLTTNVIYTACATFGPYLNDPPKDNDMFLDSGVMMLTSGSIGYYFIEWRYESITGPIVFESGETLNPADVDMQHPFSNPQPVLGGTLYPVIKYVDINGNRYSAYDNSTDRYSPDLLNCLYSVIIDAITCSTTLGADPLYPYYYMYNNNSDQGAKKSRSFKFDISDTTDYFAWEVRGYIIADQFKIYYCTVSDFNGVLLDNWIHGELGVTYTLYPENYPTNPRISRNDNTGYSQLCVITNLTSFTWASGDYLKIEITGSVYDPTNINTNWYVKFKCLTGMDMDCSFIFDTDVSKINSTPAMAYLDDPACRYEISYDTVDIVTSISRTAVGATTLFKYLNFHPYSTYNPSGGSLTTNPVKIGLRYNTTSSSQVIHSTTGINDAMNLAFGESMDISKTTNDMTFYFTDSDDYDKMVADIAAYKADSDYTTLLGLDSSDSRYYSYFRIRYYVDTKYGDNTPAYNYYFHWSCPIDYDAINLTIKITFVIPTNELSDPSCNNVYSSVAGYITNMNNTKNATLPFTTITNVRAVGFIYALWTTGYVNAENTRETFYSYSIEDLFVNGICNLSSLGFVKGMHAGSSNRWTIYRYYDKVTITDPTDHTSRLANWRLERKKFLRTDNYADTEWEIVHEEPI